MNPFVLSRGVAFKDPLNTFKDVALITSQGSPHAVRKLLRKAPSYVGTEIASLYVSSVLLTLFLDPWKKALTLAPLHGLVFLGSGSLSSLPLPVLQAVPALACPSTDSCSPRVPSDLPGEG